ncbi:15638_t:CDS:2, partial [Funneliformis mosseae]
DEHNVKSEINKQAKKRLKSSNEKNEKQSTSNSKVVELLA